MLKQIEGSQGVAEAVALCRPQVVCAYPITPQTHSVEGVGARVKAGTLENCEFINVESEFAALSVAIGASAVGARAYTATASQGLLFMAEAVYNAAGPAGSSFMPKQTRKRRTCTSRRSGSRSRSLVPSWSVWTGSF
jgi:pyruvate ferredoxin oxidoreductase alpha subunit